jgi:hypothetical protein
LPKGITYNGIPPGCQRATPKQETGNFSAVVSQPVDAPVEHPEASAVVLAQIVPLAFRYGVENANHSSFMTPQHQTIAFNLGLLSVAMLAGAAWYRLEQGPLGAQRWVEALTPENPLRFDAVAALRQLGPKARSAAPALLRVVESSDDALAPPAAGALLHVDPEIAYEYSQLLMRRVQTGTISLDTRTLALFGELGPVAWRAAPLLCHALSEPDVREPERLVWAALRMGEFGGDVLGATVRGSKDTRYGVRWESVAQLEYLGPRARSLRPEIEGLVNDPVPAIAGRAKMILLDLDVIVPYARSGLSRFPQYDESYQEYALSRLAKMGPAASDALDDVQTALHSRSTLIRFLATRTLASMGTAARPALPALDKLRLDASMLVRDGARAAVAAIE